MELGEGERDISVFGPLCCPANVGIAMCYRKPQAHKGLKLEVKGSCDTVDQKKKRIM